MDSPESPALAPYVDRREVLALAWLGAMGLAAAGAGGIFAKMLRPTEASQEPDLWHRETTLRSPQDWPTRRGEPVYLGGGGMLLLDGQQVRGYRVFCTRCGCAVGYKADQVCFICPCCGSYYDLDGVPFRGSAKKPLGGLDLRVLVDGETEYRYLKPGELLTLRDDRAQSVWVRKSVQRRVAVTR